jgi:hypothetical protein
MVTRVWSMLAEPRRTPPLLRSAVAVPASTLPDRRGMLTHQWDPAADARSAEPGVHQDASDGQQPVPEPSTTSADRRRSLTDRR